MFGLFGKEQQSGPAEDQTEQLRLPIGVFDVTATNDHFHIHIDGQTIDVPMSYRALAPDDFNTRVTRLILQHYMDNRVEP